MLKIRTYSANIIRTYPYMSSQKGFSVMLCVPIDEVAEITSVNGPLASSFTAHTMSLNHL